MNKHLPIFAYVIIGVVFGFAGYGFYTFFFKENRNYNNTASRQSTYISPKNYEECASTPGSRTLEMYPPVCVSPDGQRFVQPTINTEPDITLSE